MKRQSHLAAFYQQEAIQNLDRIAGAVAAKEAVVSQAKGWARRYKVQKGRANVLLAVLNETEKHMTGLLRGAVDSGANCERLREAVVELGGRMQGLIDRGIIKEAPDA